MDVQTLTTRAFEIADTCMLAQLESHALRAGGHPEAPLFGLVDDDGREVTTLLEASPSIVEAVEWLRERGLAEVIENEHGEAVILTADTLEL
jgi:hypothetical protein